MRLITTKAELVDWLFQMLRQADPQYTVDSSFLVAVGGMCQGLISGPGTTTPPYLAKIALTHRPGRPVPCGLKLVELARSLSEEGVLDCTDVWSASRLIRRMVAALGHKGLRIERGRGLAPSYVASTRSFAAEQGVKVRVQLGRRRRSGPVFSPPTNVTRLRRAELKEDLERRGDEIIRLRLILEVAEGREANLRAELRRTAEALRCEQQRVQQLQVSLVDGQSTIRRQQRQLANATTGGGNPIYRRVGLDEGCPDFVLKAIKKAYALELHPDRRPADQTQDAEERLKAANAVFDEIYNIRNMR